MAERPLDPAPGRFPMCAETRMAAEALATNRLQLAETKLRERLHVAPRDVVALRLLGELAGQVGRHADAEALFVEALAIAPDYLDARYPLAVVLHRQARGADALAEAVRLRAARPDEPLYRALEAAVRATVGDHAESLSLYEALFAEDMDGPRLRLSYGHGLKTVGRVTESAATYRGLVTSQRPENRALRGEAWWSLANLKTVRLDNADQTAMRTELANPSTSEDSRAHLHFALGKALEDASEAGEAFSHYSAGAAIRRRQSGYKAANTTARVQRTIDILTPDLLARRAGQGAAAPDPIFVVGLPRSGSTLVEQILASHSKVEGTMELVDLPAIAREAGLEGPQGDPAAIARLSRADLRRLGEAYISRTQIFRKTGCPLFIDKLPNNWLSVGLIHLILPAAKIIDVRRSPLAGCVSAFRQLFARGQSFSYDLNDLGRYYCDYVALMSHFDRIAPGVVHRVIYEDLIDDSETQITRLLDHCGLLFEPTCIDFHQTHRAIATPSAEQVRRPLYRQGLDRWRMFEGQLAPLEAALGPALLDWRGAPAR